MRCPHRRKRGQRNNYRRFKCRPPKATVFLRRTSWVTGCTTEAKPRLAAKKRSSQRSESRHNPETRANRYASDLLLPVSLFLPKANIFKTMDFHVVKSLAETFNTSLTSTAIRLVECGPLPTMLIYYSRQGREWFVRASAVAERLWPPQTPRSGMKAFDLLKGGIDELQGEVPAEAWFNHPEAEGHYIDEHSIRTSYSDVLSFFGGRTNRC